MNLITLVVPLTLVLLVLTAIGVVALAVGHRLADDRITPQDEQSWPPEAPSAYPAPPHPDGGTS